LAGRVACLADARPIDELQAIVTRAGHIVTRVERHDQALLDTIDRVTTRLRALRLVDLLTLRRFNLERGIELADEPPTPSSAAPPATWSSPPPHRDPPV
jgi:hypothetical protein